MFKLVAAIAVACAETAWGMARNITTCEAYLLAPDSVKPATYALMSHKTSKTERFARRQELTEFVQKAELGSDAMVEYFASLSDHSPESRTLSIDTLGERLLAEYLMRAGNEELAVRHLPKLLEAFWLDFLYGNFDYLQIVPKAEHNRVIEGYSWMENIVEYLIGLGQRYPQATFDSWHRSYEKFLPELIYTFSVERVFQRTLAYLEMRATQSPEEILEDERHYQAGEINDPAYSQLDRLNYVSKIIEELDYNTPKNDLDSLIKFYQIEDTPFASSLAFAEDMKRCKGTNLGEISPLRTFVFLYRLGRRTHDQFPQSTFDKVDSTILKIKRLKGRLGLAS